MDVSQIPLFALADRRTAWLAARQSVLAQNIANADTPHYRARDLAPFASGFAPHLALASTASGHLAGRPAPAAPVLTPPGEHAPDGNAVAIDEQLVKVADTDTAHELTLSLSRTYMIMFRTAIGKA